MTHQRLTQCPHCKASFKVSEEQLNAANGRVRCGACMNIFDAIAYSLSDPGGTASTPTPNNEPKAKPEKSAPPADDMMDLERAIEDGELFADNPEEDEQEAGYSGQNSLSDELSTSFLELEDSDHQDPYSTSFKTLDDEVEDDESVDESWTKDILDTLDSEPESRKEPSISAPEEIAPKSPAKSPETPEPISAKRLDFEGESLDFPEQKQETDSEIDRYDTSDFHYLQDSSSSGRHWLISCLFILVNLSLLLTLLAQASWYHYEKLAKYPQLKTLYSLACEQIGCTLPKLEDISKIKSQNLVVRSHPTARKALIIDTVIINTASFDQDFPNIGLYFSDINKKIIAQRLVTPDEYRSGDLLYWDKMPSEQPIHISLEILDPGKNAVNYTLEFFPQKIDVFEAL